MGTSRSALYRQRRNFHQLSGAGVPDRPFLNRDDVAAIGAEVGGRPLQAKTISQHLWESQPEVGKEGKRRPGKYAQDPFPTPDGYQGRAPWWLLERAGEIRAWFERHPRTREGVGYGGRPRKGQPNG